MDTQNHLDEMFAQFKRPHARYPYLVVRVQPAVYGIALLPTELDREQLLAIAQREHLFRQHRLRMCVVLADDDALYLDEAGMPKPGPRPYGGHLIRWQLASLSEQPALARHTN